MERTRATWTDERLDDLSRRTEAGFARLDEDLRGMQVRNDQRFDALDRRIDALQRLMIQFGGAMLVTTLATLVSVLVTRG